MAERKGGVSVQPRETADAEENPGPSNASAQRGLGQRTAPAAWGGQHCPLKRSRQRAGYQARPGVQAEALRPAFPPGSGPVRRQARPSSCA
jgi:hypothetical protein